MRAAKEGKKAGKMVLRAIKMDGATAADKERYEREIKERALTQLYNITLCACSTSTSARSKSVANSIYTGV